MSKCKALERQVGGSHYKKYAKQPLEFAEKLGLTPIMFCAFKYLTRFKDKGKPDEDIGKCLHCIDIFVEIGETKQLQCSDEELFEFLGQFEDQHAGSISLLFVLQNDKTMADYVKENIRLLLEDYNASIN